MAEVRTPGHAAMTAHAAAVRGRLVRPRRTRESGSRPTRWIRVDMCQRSIRGLLDRGREPAESPTRCPRV